MERVAGLVERVAGLVVLAAARVQRLAGQRQGHLAELPVDQWPVDPLAPPVVLQVDLAELLVEEDGEGE